MTTKNPDLREPNSRSDSITDEDRILFLMDDISRSARRAYNEWVSSVGLNQTQWRIIGLLLREPELTQAAIGKRLELESATIGQAVVALGERGLIERERTPSDKRAWRIKFTDNIETILPDLRHSADRLHGFLWKNFSAEEKLHLSKMLGRISQNLKQHSDGTG